MITNHDGIAGTWIPVAAGAVDANAEEDTAYLERLSPAVRASIYALELGTHIGFVFEPGADADDQGWGRVFHLETTLANPVPNAKYQGLIAMRRPTQDIFAEQLTLVANYADLRQDRMAEILAQLGTPTEFLRAIAYIEPSRTPYTIELLATAHWLANFVEMRLKYALGCKRPIEYSPQIQPMIWTPSHGTLPSGHATEAFTMARVLWLLLRANAVKPYSKGIWGEMLMRQAARIAINRTVAGVHFPVDSAAGAVLGLTLGRYFVDRCTHAAPSESWEFDGIAYPGDQDFDWRSYFHPNDPAGGTHPEQEQTAWATKDDIGDADANQMMSAPLNWLWGKAADEWKDLVTVVPAIAEDDES
ncbi:phosphatase PAP2 family protein [Ruegeria sediminis]|uniref:Phosphatase PAP2 family protein n=1 Tax=Ruegeria sediminis TaxID=2583820 RepID=A0ABY2WTC4_9RHOB|nr:phosphatase PAP2 family protein [Ruegeria sediminis]